MIDPLVISHGWTADNKEPGVRGPFGNSAFVDEIEMQGTRDPSRLARRPRRASPSAREHDWWQVSADCHRLAQETAARLRELTGLPALSSARILRAADGRDADPALRSDGAQRRAAATTTGSRFRCSSGRATTSSRLSCQGYNTRAQMDVLIGALTDAFAVARRRRNGHRAG